MKKNVLLLTLLILSCRATASVIDMINDITDRKALGINPLAVTGIFANNRSFVPSHSPVISGILQCYDSKLTLEAQVSGSSYGLRAVYNFNPYEPVPIEDLLEFFGRKPYGFTPYEPTKGFVFFMGFQEDLFARSDGYTGMKNGHYIFAGAEYFLPYKELMYSIRYDIGTVMTGGSRSGINAWKSSKMMNLFFITYWDW